MPGRSTRSLVLTETMALKHTPRKVKIGVAWFDRAQWVRLTEVVPDRSSLDDTFEQWERSARDTVAQLRAEGHSVKEVLIDVEQLLAWCTLRGVAPNSSSRAEYVAELVRIRNGED